MQRRGIRQVWGVAALGAGIMLMLIAGTVGSGGMVAAQEPVTPTPMPGMSQPSDTPESVRAHMDAERTRMVNDDRHKRMAEDADKLVALSNELKADVAKTGKDELSVEVLRKAAEIEKLAHDLQNRMKN
jgi:hypothetical protein